jgi:hypothetical protein
MVAIIGSIMVIAGLGFLVFMVSSEQSVPSGAYIFMIVWTGMAAWGVTYNIYNLNTGNAFPTEVVDFDDGESPRDPSTFQNYSVVDRLPDTDAPAPNPDNASRLRELQSLRDQNLITADEFAQKRNEILSQI